MSFEKYDQHKIIPPPKQPEDNLETPDALNIINRERRFNTDGGFRKLLKLKIIINDLILKDHALLPSSDPYFMEELINDPRQHGQTLLGINPRINIYTDEEVKVKLGRYLEESKILISRRMDEYLRMVIVYKTAEHSQALDGLESRLEDCKKFALEGEWKSFCRQMAETQSYLEGIEDLVNLCCGSAPEDENVRKVLKI